MISHVGEEVIPGIGVGMGWSFCPVLLSCPGIDVGLGRSSSSSSRSSFLEMAGTARGRGLIQIEHLKDQRIQILI